MNDFIEMEKVFIFCLLITTSMGQAVNVIKAMSSSIGSIVLECKQEIQFENEVIEDLLDFWNDRNQLVSNDLGCALVCVFNKMELMNTDGSVRKDNVNEFAKAMGADEEMKTKLSDLFLLCKRATSNIENQCNAALEVTKCFRYGIFQLNWAPEVYGNAGGAVTPDQMPERRDRAVRVYGRKSFDERRGKLVEQPGLFGRIIASLFNKK